MICEIARASESEVSCRIFPNSSEILPINRRVRATPSLFSSSVSYTEAILCVSVRILEQLFYYHQRNHVSKSCELRHTNQGTSTNQPKQRTQKWNNQAGFATASRITWSPHQRILRDIKLSRGREEFGRACCSENSSRTVKNPTTWCRSPPNIDR